MQTGLFHVVLPVEYVPNHVVLCSFAENCVRPLLVKNLIQSLTTRLAWMLSCKSCSDTAAHFRGRRNRSTKILPRKGLVPSFFAFFDLGTEQAGNLGHVFEQRSLVCVHNFRFFVFGDDFTYRLHAKAGAFGIRQHAT